MRHSWAAPEVAVGKHAPLESKALAIVHVQVALCAALAVQCHHQGVGVILVSNQLRQMNVRETEPCAVQDPFWPQGSQGSSAQVCSVRGQPRSTVTMQTSGYWTMQGDVAGPSRSRSLPQDCLACMETELRLGRSLKGSTRPPRNQVGMVSRDTAKLASDLPAVMCSTPECASNLRHARHWSVGRTGLAPHPRCQPIRTWSGMSWQSWRCNAELGSSASRYTQHDSCGC